MIPRRQIPTELSALIAMQNGVFSYRQWSGAGGSRELLRRMVNQERCHRMASGVYSLALAPDWRGVAWAGLLVGGSRAVLGGSAAGHLHGLCEAPEVLDVWTPNHSSVNGPWRFRRGIRPGIGEPSRLRIVDAVLEMAADQPPSQAEDTIIAALRSRRTSVKRLRERVSELSALRNRREILEALMMASDGAESVLEANYLRLVERAHGLPAAERQLSVSLGTRSDVAYVAYGVLVELDGKLGHGGAGAFRDAIRDNAHVLDGWVTLRFGWWDVSKTPCQVAQIVAATLARAGWTGQVRSCGRCP